MDKQAEDAILAGTRFSSRQQVAEEIASLCRQIAALRPDEGTTAEDDRRRENVQSLLDEVKLIGQKLGITETEIAQGRISGQNRVDRITHQIHMTERTASALANLGESSLSDSELNVMDMDPDFAARVRDRADQIKKGKKTKP